MQVYLAKLYLFTYIAPFLDDPITPDLKANHREVLKKQSEIETVINFKTNKIRKDDY